MVKVDVIMIVGVSRFSSVRSGLDHEEIGKQVCVIACQWWQCDTKVNGVWYQEIIYAGPSPMRETCETAR